MANRLWTPDGDVSTHERNIQECTQQEMKVFENLHDLAQKLQLQLTCYRCGSPFEGYNQSPNSRTLSIVCKCREIRATIRGNIIQ